MIRVIRGKEAGAGRFEFSIPSLKISGISHQPLLDACRLIIQAGGDPGTECGLFRPGRDDPDLTVSSVRAGAELTTKESRFGGGPKFRKYVEFAGLNDAPQQ